MQRARIAALHKRAHGLIASTEAVDKLFLDMCRMASDNGVIIKKLPAKAKSSYKLEYCKYITEFLVQRAKNQSKFDSKHRRLMKMAAQERGAMSERLFPRLEEHLKKITKTPIKDMKSLITAIFETASILNLTGDIQAGPRFVNVMYAKSRAFSQLSNEYILAHELALFIDESKARNHAISIASMIRTEELGSHKRLIKESTELNMHIRDTKPKDRQQLTALLYKVNGFLIRCRGSLLPKEILVGKDARSKVHMEALKAEFTKAIDEAITTRINNAVAIKLSRAKTEMFRNLQTQRNLQATKTKFKAQ